jgi:Phage integrase family
MESKAQLIKRARIYDAQERASDHGIGHPGGPTGWRKPSAPPATGNAAKLRRLRKLHPELHALCMAGELTVNGAAEMAGFNKPGPKPKSGRIPTKIMSISERWEAGLLGANEAQRGDDPNQPRRDLKRPWDAVTARAGLVGVRLHDLRHTYASFGAGGGLGLPIIGRLLGHSQAATTARYAHLDNDPLRRASEAIAGRIAAALDGNRNAAVVRLRPAG